MATDDPVGFIALILLIGFSGWALFRQAKHRLKNPRRPPPQRQFRNSIPRSAPARVIFFTALLAPLPAFVLAVAGESAAARGLWTTALGVILVAGVVALVDRVQRIRRIEDMATSRIRSAAQGYVEIQGKAKPVSRLTQCPACHVECVWWSVVDAEGKRHSGEVPFIVEDGTDLCVVDPRGAEWIIQESFCSRSAYESRLAYLDGGRHVLAGDMLYLQGEFRTDRSGQGPDPKRVQAGAQATTVAAQRIQRVLATPQGRAAADTDRDGALSIAERQALAARIKAEIATERGLDAWQSEVHVMGPPQDGRPYVIATESQGVALRRQGRQLVLMAGGVLAVAAALAWSLATL